jgi:hypothetical protein
LSDLPLLRSAAELRQLTQGRDTTPCSCALRRCGPWDSVSEGDWPREHMAPVGTLRDSAEPEPTFEEFHPDGTRYESPDAPVAIRFFPFNRCDIWLCGRCDQHWLRYTEFGGYYVDQRARRLQPEQIVD